MTKKELYFDYAATTPVDSKVFKVMKRYFSEDFGNPSNLYDLGRKAKLAIQDSLEKISLVLGCDSDEFIFTGSATESDNIALLGVARANKHLGKRIIVSAVEHKGVLAACDQLKKEGFEVVKIGVHKNGLIDFGEVRKSVNKNTVLVSITHADNETGTIQPIKKMAEMINGFRRKNKQSLPYFHTDASQTLAYLDVNVKKLGVDLMTISAHKIYGPKGIGGLFVKKGVKIEPIIFGGGQQRKLRSGTENIAGIVGFGEAVLLAHKNRKKEYARIKKLRDKLEKGIFKKISKVILNGHPKRRLPNFLNISILDIEGEALLLYLDKKKIFVNTGSACNSQSLEPSYILSALGRPYEYIHGSIRFSLGKYNNIKSVNYVLKHLPWIVKRLRKISPLNLSLKDIDKKMPQPKAFVGRQTPHFLRK